jgi:Uma2 family endonuclease
MSDKAAYYLANGSQMVWLIYPNRRLVEVLTADERYLLTVDGTISGGELLPGFSIAVRDLFPADEA